MVQGSIWTIAGHVLSNALRLGGNLLLTRLLFPEAFGLMALVNVFMQGLTMLSDIGIGPSIIQSQRGDDPAFLNTAFTIQAIRGIALWTFACILAWPVSHFYRNPMLLMLMPVVGSTAAIAGFNSTKIFTSNRRLHLGRITVLEVGSYSAGLLVMVVWAMLRPSVWALVASGVVSAVVKMVLSHFIERDRFDRFAWEPTAKAALFKFGRWIFVSSTISFLAGQTDRLLLGKLIPLKVLGVYSVAYFLASSVVQLHSELARRVLFPTLSRKVGGGEDPRPGLVRYKRIVTPLFLLLLALLGGFAEQIIHFLYDRRYASAGWMLATFCVGRTISIVMSPTSLAILAKGRPDIPALVSFVEFITLVTGMLVGFRIADVHGAVVAAAFAGTAPTLVMWVLSARQGLSTFKLDAGMIVSAGASAALLRFAPLAMSADLAMTALLASAALVSLLWAAMLWGLNRELLRGLLFR